MSTNYKQKACAVIILLVAVSLGAVYFFYSSGFTNQEKGECLLDLMRNNQSIVFNSSSVNNKIKLKLQSCSRSLSLPEEYYHQAAIHDFEVTTELNKYLSKFKNKKNRNNGARQY
ncbi:MAG: hypothetical protein P1U74_04805 [Legionellaceae bacterium]|nr:hypothetical protein [Legionellaceae bacterium]